MKKLFTLALVIACAAAARQRTVPTLATSCPCDSSVLVPWGDGTFRSIVVVGGTGYAPGELVRVTWNTGWSFDSLAGDDGTFAQVWTGVPVGSYAITASQPRNRVKWDVVAAEAVEVY